MDGTELALPTTAACNAVPTMDTIVLLITFSAGAFAMRCKEQFRRLLPARAAKGGVLVDRVLGLARLELPDGWRAARDLNEAASIEAMNPPHASSEFDREFETEIVAARAIVSHRMPLSQAAEGYEMFEQKEALKVVLDPSA